MADIDKLPRVTDRTVLWRTDGARYGRSDVIATPPGGLEVNHHDMGAADHAAWGEDDNEQSLTLTPAATAQLAITLLKERFGGQPGAISAIHAYCEANDIATTLSSWT